MLRRMIECISIAVLRYDTQSLCRQLSSFMSQTVMSPDASTNIPVGWKICPNSNPFSEYVSMNRPSKLNTL